MGGKKKKNEISGLRKQLDSQLRQNRSQGKQKAVDGIMRTRTGMEWKLNQIKRIDGESKLSDPVSGTVAAANNETVSNEPAGDPSIISNRKKLKNRPQYNKLLHYLLVDLPKIKAFGRKTHILVSGLIPFWLRLNREVERFFMDYLQKRYLPRLLPVFNHISREGWKRLTKKEYNLCQVFKQLCMELFTLDFNLLPYSDRHLVDKIRPMERYFLILWSRPDYISDLCKAARKGIGEEQKYIAERKGLEMRIQRILQPELTLPSLYNFILGLNMFKYRRFLKLSNLICRDTGPLISNTVFECSSPVQGKIKAFVDETENNLLPVIRRRDEILKMKAFLPPANTANPFELLEFFYDDEDSNPPRVFKKDREDAIGFALRLSGRFLEIGYSVLNGTIRIEGKGSVEIFSQNFFALELSKLKTQHDMLARLNYVLPNMNCARFYELNLMLRNALSVEIEVVQTINGLSNLLVEIGQKLAQVILGRQREGGRMAPEASQRLEPEILGHRTYRIPYSSRRVEIPAVLQGRSVLDALSFICCICMLCGEFFHNRQVHSLVGNEEKIKRKIKLELETLQRLNSPSAFEAFRRKYKI